MTGVLVGLAVYAVGMALVIRGGALATEAFDLFRTDPARAARFYDATRVRTAVYLWVGAPLAFAGVVLLAAQA